MVLCVDAGNTNIVLGGYLGGRLVFLSRIATQPALQADQYALQIEGVLALHGAAKPQGAILSSVVPPVTGALCGALQLLCGTPPLVLSRALCPEVPICIYQPDELGADLLAGAVAARARCRMPAVVIDMGTATKLTALDAAGAVQGVSILPGMMVSLNALISGASQLSAVATQAPAHAIGKNTAESIQSGIVLGTADLLDGMLARFEAEGFLQQAGTVGCKRYYRLTAAGKAVYDGERARLQRCLDDAARAAITAPASLTKGAEHDENERETDRAPSGALPAL